MNENIKKENRKAFWPFLLFIFCGGFVGGLLGATGHLLKGATMNSILHKANHLLLAWSPILIVICSFILLSVSFIILFGCKSRYKQGNLDDKELDRIEYRLNFPLALSSISMIINCFLFGCILVGTYGFDAPFSPLGVLTFVISLALIVVIQKLIVDLEKMINPEKRGSVFDQNFAKVWEASCDEAERLMIYKSSYESFKATNMTCIVLWVVLTLCNIVFVTGILPILTVTLIWLVQTLSYTVAAMRLERLGMRKNEE